MSLFASYGVVVVDANLLLRCFVVWFGVPTFRLVSVWMISYRVCVVVLNVYKLNIEDFVALENDNRMLCVCYGYERCLCFKNELLMWRKDEDSDLAGGCLH